jgi:hypothetical protein
MNHPEVALSGVPRAIDFARFVSGGRELTLAKGAGGSRSNPAADHVFSSGPLVSRASHGVLRQELFS